MSTDPLDILLPPTSELLRQTEEVLHAAEVSHGPLTLQADVSQNVAITDHSTVFIKVYRRKDGLNEPKHTRIAVAHGAITPHLYTYTEWCSVWEYLPLAPLPLEALPETLATVKKVHDNTRGSTLIEEINYGESLAVITGRLKKVLSHPLSGQVSVLAEEVTRSLEEATTGEELVFTHSDLQLKNMGLAPHGPVVFDWEICKMAPIELELSKLEENLFTANLWTSSLMQDLYGAPLRRDILTLATKLRYLQNIAFHLERVEEGIAQRQFAALGRFTATMAVQGV